MSGVGFWELFLLFIIGLLILGPEKLPRVASQIGRWVGRARRTANQLRYQLEREIALADLEKATKDKKPADTKKPSAGAGDNGGAGDEAVADDAAVANDEAGAGEQAGAGDHSASSATPPVDRGAESGATPETTGADPGDDRKHA